MLKDQRILLGVTGSIAAYKACDLVQRLKEKGASVRVLMTESAAKLVHPNTFAALTGAPVSFDAWADAGRGAMRHIEDARWGNAFVVAPCTAHTTAELSLGLTGSPISMTAMAYQGPLIVAPAMNTLMLHSQPMREHLERLGRRGAFVLPTVSGELACGELGEGKLLSPDEIASYVELVLKFGSSVPNLSGVKVLISGGHTEEPLDDVRFLSNRSSGKTALAMARAFRLAGAEVKLVLGVCEQPPPAGIQLVPVRTSEEFDRAMHLGQLDADVIVMAAAIADFVPAQRGKGKWKDSKSLKNIELKPSKNVLSELGKNKSKNQILVGFALEAEKPIVNAMEKLKSRNCDLMVVNNPLSKTGFGFGEEAVEAAIVDSTFAPKGNNQLALKEKTQLAADLVKQVATRVKRVSPT